MNQRLVTILLSAFLTAVGASYVVYRLVGKQMTDSARHRATRIVVASRDLEVGSIVKASDLTTADLVGDIPKDAVLKPDGAVGRAVLSPVYAGEPMIGKRLAVPGSGGGLAATIPPGMRACAVKVNDVVGVAGFVLPGMRVDVLIYGSSSGPQSTPAAKVRTLLQNIEVLSAGKNFQRDEEGKPIEAQVVNLLVTPAQAELLSLADNDAHIQLVLRNPVDRQITTPPGSQLESLFGDPAPKAQTAPQPEPPKAPAPVPAPQAEKIEVPPKPALPAALVVQVINGGKQTEQRFDMPGDIR